PPRRVCLSREERLCVLSVLVNHGSDSWYRREQREGQWWQSVIGHFRPRGARHRNQHSALSTAAVTLGHHHTDVVVAASASQPSVQTLTRRPSLRARTQLRTRSRSCLSSVLDLPRALC